MKLKLTVIGLAAAIFCSTAQAAPFSVKLTAFPGSSFDLIVDQIGTDYYAKIEDLSSFTRLKISKLPNRNGVVNLSEVGVVSFDDLNSTMTIRFKADFLTPQIIGEIQESTIPTEAPLQKALLIDYDIRGEKRSHGVSKLGALVGASTWWGAYRIDTAGVIDSDSSNNQVTQIKAIRENLNNSSFFEVGTISGQDGTRAAPVAIIGIGIGKNRSVTPGFITGPRLRVDGIANTKSTVDVLLQNQAGSISKTVEPGPFSVIALPSIEGNSASVIIKDELGIDRVVTTSLFANPTLLGVGQSEYSLSAGGLQSYGLSTSGMASQGYYRRGITNFMTMEIGAVSRKTNAGVSESHLNLATDVATVFGDFSLDVRGVGKPLSTTATYNAPSLRLGDWRLYGSGSASFRNAGETEQGYAKEKNSSKVMSLRASSGGTTIYATSIKSNNMALQTIGATHRFESLGATLQASATRYQSASGKVNSSLSASMSFPFGGSSFSTGVRGSDEGLRKRFSGSTAVGSGFNVGAAIEGTHDIDIAQLNGSAQFSAAAAQVTVQKTDAMTSVQGTVRGSLLAYGGKVMAMRSSSDNGFAVFDLGEQGAGVKVRSGFGQYTKTDAIGFAAVSILPLRQVKLGIDVDTAPEGMDVTSVSVSVHRKGGVLMSRRAVSGKFFKFAGTTPGSTLTINGTTYPITDRGAWVELPAGVYEGSIEDRKVEVVMPSKL